MANKSLTDLVARTATALTDLLHINSGGTDYKQTKHDFLCGDFAYTFANDTAITTQADALGSIGQYTGKINSYGHQAATGMPRNNSFYVTITIYSSNYKKIEATDVDVRRTYVKYKINGTWDSSWIELPSRSELDTALGYIKELGTINGSGSLTFTCSNGTRALICMATTASTRNGVWTLFVGSTGSSAYMIPVGDIGSNISVSINAPSVTITSNAGQSYIQPIFAIILTGSITV